MGKADRTRCRTNDDDKVSLVGRGIMLAGQSIGLNHCLANNGDRVSLVGMGAVLAGQIIGLTQPR